MVACAGLLVLTRLRNTKNIFDQKFPTTRNGNHNKSHQPFTSQELGCVTKQTIIHTKDRRFILSNVKTYIFVTHPNGLC